MHRLKDKTEASESQSASYKGFAIIHLESVFENKAVTIWVTFQFHRDREIVSLLSNKEALGDYFLAIFQICSRIHGGFDGSSWIPTELVPNRVFVSDLCNR
jgi:hypothetical protein